jgi:hypothetical protein
MRTLLWRLLRRDRRHRNYANYPFPTFGSCECPGCEGRRAATPERRLAGGTE